MRSYLYYQLATPKKHSTNNGISHVKECETDQSNTDGDYEYQTEHNKLTYLIQKLAAYLRLSKACCISADMEH